MATWIAVSACLTLGFIHLRMWFKERDRWAHFLFAMIAFSVILFAVFELAMMHSTATAEYGEYLRWSHVGVWCMVVSSAFICVSI